MNSASSSEGQDSQGSKDSFGGSFDALAFEGGTVIQLHACSREIATQFQHDHPFAYVRPNLNSNV